MVTTKQIIDGVPKGKYDQKEIDAYMEKQWQEIDDEIAEALATPNNTADEETEQPQTQEE